MMIMGGGAVAGLNCFVFLLWVLFLLLARRTGLMDVIELLLWLFLVG
jgi:hypothetical protein